MKLQEALNTSDNDTATLEYNGLYTTVDGSIGDGNYSISTGVEGMPASEHQTVSGLDAALAAIRGKGLDTDEWQAIGEDTDS